MPRRRNEGADLARRCPVLRHRCPGPSSNWLRIRWVASTTAQSLMEIAGRHAGSGGAVAEQGHRLRGCRAVRGGEGRSLPEVRATDLSRARSSLYPTMPRRTRSWGWFCWCASGRQPTGFTWKKLITLTPGMEVTADIKTGKRSVVGYFLGPLLESAEESMRERQGARWPVTLATIAVIGLLVAAPCAHAFDVLRTEEGISETPAGSIVPDPAGCQFGPPARPLLLAGVVERALCASPKTRGAWAEVSAGGGPWCRPGSVFANHHW